MRNSLIFMLTVGALLAAACTSPTQSAATAAPAPNPTAMPPQAALKPTVAPAVAATQPVASSAVTPAFVRPDVPPLGEMGNFKVAGQSPWPGEKVRVFFLGVQF
jgi:hypothetical protein